MVERIQPVGPPNLLNNMGKVFTNTATLCRQATSEHPSVRDMKAPLSTSGVCLIQKLLLSRGPKKGRKCYVIPAFSGVPNAKRGEKIRSGCLTPAFSGAQNRAEVLRNPCILRGPQRQERGENQKWLPHPYLLGGPKQGGSAT